MSAAPVPTLALNEDEFESPRFGRKQRQSPCSVCQYEGRELLEQLIVAKIQAAKNGQPVPTDRDIIEQLRLAYPDIAPPSVHALSRHRSYHMAREEVTAYITSRGRLVRTVDGKAIDPIDPVEAAAFLATIGVLDILSGQTRLRGEDTIRLLEFLAKLGPEQARGNEAVQVVLEKALKQQKRGPKNTVSYTPPELEVVDAEPDQA